VVSGFDRDDFDVVAGRDECVVAGAVVFCVHGEHVRTEACLLAGVKHVECRLGWTEPGSEVLQHVLGGWESPHQLLGVHAQRRDAVAEEFAQAVLGAPLEGGTDPDGWCPAGREDLIDAVGRVASSSLGVGKLRRARISRRGGEPGRTANAEPDGGGHDRDNYRERDVGVEVEPVRRGHLQADENHDPAESVG